MNRRQVITAAGIGGTVLLAGCASDGSADGAGGGSPEPLNGEWSLRARVSNDDDEPRAWRVASRSVDRESSAAASGVVPAGEAIELELVGQLFDERREVVVETDAGAVSEAWRPTECRRLFAAVGISAGRPRLETECLEG